MKRTQLTPDMLSEKAFKTYSESDIEVWKDGDNFKLSGGVVSGLLTLKEVNHFFESELQSC